MTMTDDRTERSLAIPPQLERARTRLHAEYDDLPERDRELLSLETIRRWTDGLHPDDVDLSEIAGLERRRRMSLRSMRQGPELTDQEHQLLRYLQRNEGQVMSYLKIARHLWQTPRYRVTANSLRAHGGYAAPMVTAIQVLVHSIRKKQEIDPWRPQHLANVRGVGYVWYAEPPHIDDGINYEQRSLQASKMRIETIAMFGGDVEAPPNPEFARLVNPDVKLPEPVIEAEYEPVEDADEA